MEPTNSRPLRGALIGFGFIQSKGHVPVYLDRPDVKIVAVADFSEARRGAAQEALPEARVYTDHEILFEQEESLDFVDIATPPSAHAEIALAALERGIHVLCESPLTTKLEDAEQLLKAAQQHRRVLFPCQTFKHAPVLKAVRKVLDSGKIGKVRSVTVNTFRNSHDKGVPEWKANWRREHRYGGGGIAMDQGSHAFYLAFDWLGTYPTRVTTKMTNLEPEKYDTEDNFSSTLTFPTGLAHVHLTWTAGVRKVLYTIQGEKGAITVNDDVMQVATLRHSDGPDQWDLEESSYFSDWMDTSHTHWFGSLFDQFQKAIAAEDFVGKEAREAYLCVQLIANAYRSAQESCREITLT